MNSCVDLTAAVTSFRCVKSLQACIKRQSLGIQKGALDKRLKVPTTKGKLDHWEYTQLRCTAKETSYGVKMYLAEWEKNIYKLFISHRTNIQNA